MIKDIEYLLDQYNLMHASPTYKDAVESLYNEIEKDYPSMLKNNKVKDLKKIIELLKVAEEAPHDMSDSESMHRKAKKKRRYVPLDIPEQVKTPVNDTPIARHGLEPPNLPVDELPWNPTYRRKSEPPSLLPEDVPDLAPASRLSQLNAAKKSLLAVSQVQNNAIIKIAINALKYGTDARTVTVHGSFFLEDLRAAALIWQDLPRIKPVEKFKVPGIKTPTWGLPTTRGKMIKQSVVFSADIFGNACWVHFDVKPNEDSEYKPPRGKKIAGGSSAKRTYKTWR